MSTTAQAGGSAAPPISFGVIREARRRRRRRVAVYGALGSVAVAAALGWGTSEGATHGTPPDRAAAATTQGVTLVPGLSVGQAGWCLLIRGGASACGGVQERGQPFLQAVGWGPASGHREAVLAITAPSIVAVMIEGRRVPTVPLAGQAFGLRIARTFATFRAMVTAIDANGRVVVQRWMRFPARQGVRLAWHAPQSPPAGACALSATTLAGLRPLDGAVAAHISPYPGVLAGSAFLTCASTEYALDGTRMTAAYLLDAAQPGSAPALLPDVHRSRVDPALFDGSGFVAEREGPGWLLVTHGATVAADESLLRHLRARLTQ
jgi:hypothetical protein